MLLLLLLLLVVFNVISRNKASTMCCSNGSDKTVLRHANVCPARLRMSGEVADDCKWWRHCVKIGSCCRVAACDEAPNRFNNSDNISKHAKTISSLVAGVLVVAVVLAEVVDDRVLEVDVVTILVLESRHPSNKRPNNRCDT